MAGEADHLWKIEDVAEYVGLSVNAVYKMTGPKAPIKIPHIRLRGRLIRFRKADIDRWLDLLTVSNMDMLEKLRGKSRPVALYGKDPRTQTA